VLDNDLLLPAGSISLEHFDLSREGARELIEGTLRAVLFYRKV
jgi:hypothetical protein